MSQTQEVQGEPAQDTPPPEPTPSPWQRLRQRWWMRWLIDGLIVLAVVLAITAFQGRNLLGSSTPAPDFSLTSMDGEVVTLSSLRGKQVVLLFWAPWCGVCKVESSNVSAVHQSADPDVQVLSVVLGYEDRDQVQAFMDEHGVDYPVLLGDPTVSSTWKVDKFPTVYVIDEEGAVKHATVGYSTELGIRARLLL